MVDQDPKPKWTDAEIEALFAGRTPVTELEPFINYPTRSGDLMPKHTPDERGYLRETWLIDTGFVKTPPRILSLLDRPASSERYSKFKSPVTRREYPGTLPGFDLMTSEERSWRNFRRIDRPESLNYKKQIVFPKPADINKKISFSKDTGAERPDKRPWAKTA